MTKTYLDEPSQKEITVKDLICFFYESWRVILTCGILGALGGAGLLVFSKIQFEAVAQIRMSQIPVGAGKFDSSVNLEDPDILIARLKLPSSFTIKEINECELSREKDPAEKLVSLIKFSHVKANSSSVELKVQGESKKQVINCANGLFEFIRQSQADLLFPQIEEAKKLVTSYEMQRQEAIKQLHNPNYSEVTSYFLTVATLDEIRFLSNEILRLNSFIAISNRDKARLVAPIYASIKSTYLSRQSLIFLGLFVGLIFGALLAILSKSWSKPIP